VLLSLLGGVLGLLLGMAAANTVSSLNVRGPIPFLIDLHFDWNVFDFALGAALAAGCVAGLIPAVRATREHLAETLQQGGRSISSGRQLFGSALVVVQVAGSLMLLVVAALFVKSLFNARRVELGYEPSHVANITLNGDEAGYSEAQGRELITTLLARVRGMPGVVSASLAFSVPMGYFSASNALEIPGYQPPPAQGFPSTGYNLITPGYFRTMGIPLVYGREFTDADGEKSQRVAIINEAMAERFWPGAPGNAIGRRFQMMDDPQHWYEVIGVSKNSRIREFSGPYPTYAYLPLTQLYSAVQTLQVRTIGDPELLIPALQRTIESIAPGMPLFGSQTMQQALMTFNGLLRYEIGATLAAVLGMLGLILAVVGLYGVVSYAAAQRTHEIGIRMALGAKARQILGMIVRQGLLLVSIGVLAGLMAALGLTRLLGRFLVGVSASDPLLFATTAVLLGGVALAACYIPARRATRVDPISALRVE
jgi:predicted permease